MTDESRLFGAATDRGERRVLTGREPARAGATRRSKRGPRQVFRRTVWRWWQTRETHCNLAYGQLAYWGYGAGGPSEISKIARVLGAPRYQQYFQRVGYTLSPRWPCIQRDFPELTGGRASVGPPAAEIEHAFRDEIRSASRKLRLAAVEVTDPRITRAISGRRRLVRFSLDPRLDQEPDLHRGDDVRILPRDGAAPIMAKVGEVRMRQKHLILAVGSRRTSRLPREAIVEPAPYPITRRFSEAVDAQLNKSALSFGVQSLFDSSDWQRAPRGGATRVAEVFDQTALNPSQRAAVRACLGRRVTPVWGPPGTGKTHTLVRLLLTLALAGERVLVVAPSNVAVDQIALRLLHLADRFPAVGALLHQRRVVRLGHPKNKAVVASDLLYPDVAEIEMITDLIRQWTLEIEALEALEAAEPFNAEVVEERIARQLDVKEAIAKRDQATRLFAESCPVILTTTHTAGVGVIFAGPHQRDTVIIDEASMVSLPHAIPAAARAEKRLVFFGDFQQLAPVVQSATDVSERWLGPDLFRATGLVAPVDERLRLTAKGHTLTQMLTTQHRMHRDIAAVSSAIFYDGRLSTVLIPRPTPAWIDALPSRALMIELTPGVDAGEVVFTNGGSRYNARSAQIVEALVRRIHAHTPTLSITIISPYRAHSQRLRAQLSDLDDALRIGTVHAMQGSEADIVIWDLVDVRDPARRVRAGCLYRGYSGNRLFNVALTRARQVVMLIGDPGTFTHLGSGVQSMASAIQRRLLAPMKHAALLRRIPPAPLPSG